MMNRFFRLCKNSELSSLFLIVLVGAVLTACNPSPNNANLQEWIFSGPIMGTDYRVVIIGSEDLDAALTEKRILASMESVNQSMSTYISDSELSRFNRMPAEQSMHVSDDLNAVVTEALEIAARTQGAFDPTIGPAVNLWGFGPQGRIEVKPEQHQLDAVRESIGYQKVVLSQALLSKKVANVTLDLSAIAKGYAVDKVAGALRDIGIARFLINIGGELRASGAALSGEAWRVAIEKPQLLGGVQQVIALSDRAIATSGDYRNYLLIDGLPFSHTISSATLQPVYHRLASVSVLSDRTSTADALATALMAMGEERAIDFVEKNNLAVYMLIRKPASEVLETYISDEFNVNLQ